MSFRREPEVEPVAYPSQIRAMSHGRRLEQALEAVLQEAWQTGYSDFLKSELRQLAGDTKEPTIEVAKRPESQNP